MDLRTNKTNTTTVVTAPEKVVHMKPEKQVPPVNPAMKNVSSTVVPKEDLLMKKNEFTPLKTPAKRVGPKIVPKPVNRGKEAAKARSRAMLAKLMPFDRWVATMSDQHTSRVKRLGFELKEFHDYLVGLMFQESINPTPTRIFVPHHGSRAKARFYYD